MVARDLLKDDHPLHITFVNWLNERNPDAVPTKRQAARFLAAFPRFREEREAA